ncbi:MAG: zf-HC2 domain-containing protein [Vicinamibacteria bacterium]|nr:zf-HC2 domain-containing protein [Vicinamibacteria bacterium]
MNCTAPEAELVAGLSTGTLSPSDSEAVRRHLADCEECRVDAAFVAEMAATLRSLHLTERELVAAAWARQRPAHVLDCASCREEYEALLAVDADLRAGQARVPWVPVAAALLVAVLGAGLWKLEPRPAVEPVPGAEVARLGEAERRLAQAESRLATLEREAVAPHLNVPIIDLEPNAATRGPAAAGRLVELAANATTVTFVVVTRPMPPHDSYTLEVLGSAAEPRFVADGLLRSPYDTLTLSVPRALLPAGEYRFVLYGRRGGDRERVETYAVSVRHRP